MNFAAGGSARAVLERLRDVVAAQPDARLVLAVVVRTEGSTYRKRGALALIEADGRKTGVLSGGCLESQLVSAALAALQADRPHWLVFDSLADDDLLFGSGSGCRGRTQVVLWPLAADRDAGVLARWTALLASPSGAGLMVDADAAVPSPALVDLSVVTGSDALRIGPLPRVWIIGAGAEAGVLAGLLRAQGWWLGLSEHRASWREVVDLTAVDLLLPVRPRAARAQLLPADVMLVMSHSAETDLEALRIAAVAAVPVVGLLGPPSRRDALLSELSADQRAQLAGRLVAPVGLRLGGEGPMAIALSISAWLLGVPPR